jgi:hypothetical protein
MPIRREERSTSRPSSRPRETPRSSGCRLREHGISRPKNPAFASSPHWNRKPTTSSRPGGYPVLRSSWIGTDTNDPTESRAPRMVPSLKGAPIAGSAIRTSSPAGWRLCFLWRARFSTGSRHVATRFWRPLGAKKACERSLPGEGLRPWGFPWRGALWARDGLAGARRMYPGLRASQGRGFTLGYAERALQARREEDPEIKKATGAGGVRTKGVGLGVGSG